MLLSLLIYLAPVLALTLYWQAHRGLPLEALETGVLEDLEPSVWGTLADKVRGGFGHARAVVGATVLGAVALGVIDGGPGGVAFVAGAAMSVFCSSVTYAWIAGVEGGAARTLTSGDAWAASESVSVATAAMAAGTIGTLAWFFADPSGTAMLAFFLIGASSAALFLATAFVPGRAVGESERPRAQEGEVAETNGPLMFSADLGARVASTGDASLHAHLAALIAAVTVAATAQSEELLTLGNLLAESETLRNELLVLPIAITIVAPFGALVAGRFFSMLLKHRAASDLQVGETVAAVLMATLVLVLVLTGGLAWTVAGAFGVGVLARQLAVVAQGSMQRLRAAGRRSSPFPLPALLALIGLGCGEALAGTYGLALAAMGMTSTFASGAAVVMAREMVGETDRDRTATIGTADTAAEASVVAATLALLVAASPVLAAESARRGMILSTEVVSAPSLLVGVLVGAVCSLTLATAVMGVEEESEAVRTAFQAVVSAIALPLLVGAIFGAGAAVGLALGVTAWSAIRQPYEMEEGLPPHDLQGWQRSALLAWGRTMALSILVGAPVMI